MLYSLSRRLVPQNGSQQPPPGINYPSRSRRSCGSLGLICITEAEFAPLHPGSEFKPLLDPLKEKSKMLRVWGSGWEKSIQM